jgi:uncharacterized protein YwlG (UPF0340 family)
LVEAGIMLGLDVCAAQNRVLAMEKHARNHVRIAEQAPNSHADAD